MKRENVKSYWYSILPCAVILLGVLFRLKGFWANPSFWHDECAMAWNIKFKSYPELFGILRFLQVTPPFFSVATKFLTQIFGYSEMVFRFIPFITGCSSIVLFYWLSKKVLTVPSSVFWATFLFSINQELINYSFEFKPYGVDVFFTLICLLLFVNLGLDKLNIKKALLYGVSIAIVPWFSFVSSFVIAGGVLNIFITEAKKKSLRNKAIYALFLPVFISALFYLKFYIMNNYTGTHMTSDWYNYFVTLNPIHFLYLLANNLKYLFSPLKYALFTLILLVWGVIIYKREKSEFFNISILTLLIFFAASFMHVYPFAERVILFLIPIFLLFIVKPLDLIPEKFSDKKLKLFIILFLMFFTAYPQVKNIYEFAYAKTIDRGEYPREMLAYIAKNIKPKDKIVVNSVSNTEFAYYSSFYDIKNEVIQESSKDKTKGNRFKFLSSLTFLDSLKPDHYWFYCPFDYEIGPVNPWFETWALRQKILYFSKNNRSTLMYVYVK